MKAFFYPGLLIAIAIVVGGCVDPRVYMSLDVRLLADGYPPEYVKGYVAGFKCHFPEVVTAKTYSSLDDFAARAHRCSGENEEVKVEQDPKNSKSYQQGRADGKGAGALALYHYSQYLEEARKTQEMYSIMKPLSYQEQRMLNKQLENFDKY